MNRIKYLWVLDYSTGRVFSSGFYEKFLNKVDIEDLLDRFGFDISNVHYMVTDYRSKGSFTEFINK